MINIKASNTLLILIHAIVFGMLMIFITKILLTPRTIEGQKDIDDEDVVDDKGLMNNKKINYRFEIY